MLSVLRKATTLWLGIALLAILNAGFREAVLQPTLGSTLGLSMSGVTLSGCVLLVAYFAASWYGPLPPLTYWLIGVYWFTLTVIFEFGFGLFIQGKSWSELLAAYTFQDGNLWLIILMVILVAPWLTAKFRGLV